MTSVLPAVVAFARVRRVLLLLGLVFAALPVGSALAQSPTVFAAYTDGFRTAPSSHPSPWQGSPNVIFEGCNYFHPIRCPLRKRVPRYDAGALMLANDTNQAMTVTGASVTIGSCTFEPWPGLNVTVTPGQKLILTQTGGATPCDLRVAGAYNFDTSETNHSRRPCRNDHEFPEFHVTVDGQALTYRDTGQILNTRGKDRGTTACGAHNETHDTWARISPGGMLGAPPPPGASSPILSAFRASPRRLSLAGRRIGGRCVKPTRENRNHKPCTRPIAIKLRYTLDAAATVIFTLKRLEPGRKVHGRCVKVTRNNRGLARCTRPIRLVGALTHASTAGSNAFTFHGRIGGKRLSPGTYRLTATPVASGSLGSPRTVTFKLVG